MKVRVAASAPVGPPDTGTSAKDPRPEIDTAFATSRDVGTSMVLHSMNVFDVGDFEIERRPFVELVNTSLTCFPAGNMVMIIMSFASVSP